MDHRTDGRTDARADRAEALPGPAMSDRYRVALAHNALCKQGGQMGLTRLAARMGLSPDAARCVLVASNYFTLDGETVCLSLAGARQGRENGTLVGEIGPCDLVYSDELDDRYWLDPDAGELDRVRELIARGGWRPRQVVELADEADGPVRVGGLELEV